jgi:hypothetical protein
MLATTSVADVGGMAIEMKPSCLSFVVVRQIAAVEQPGKMASDMVVRRKRRCHWILPLKRNCTIDMHQRLLSVYGDQTVDERSDAIGGGWWYLQWRQWCETDRVLGGPAQLSAPEQKSASISKSAQIGANHQIWPLHKLKIRISRVRPEMKTTVRLQHHNARPHTSLKTMENVMRFGRTVLPHPPHCPDFHLFSSQLWDSVSPPLVKISTSATCGLLFIAGENA